MVRNRDQLGDGGKFLYEMMARHFEWDDVVYTAPTRTFGGALDLKVGDKLVQLVAQQQGMSHPVLDAIVVLVDERIAANRKKAVAA